MTNPTHPAPFGATSPFPRVENVTFSVSLGNGVVHGRVGSNVFTVARTHHLEEFFKKLQEAAG
jgi:hypothetical protein